MSENAISIAKQNFSTEERTRSYYEWRAEGYDKATRYEIEHHCEAIQLASIQPGMHVLEVACGTGRATLELAKQVGPEGKLDALDLSQAMLDQASKKISENGLNDRVFLRTGNALHLPFPDAVFDVLYNSYMFDLVAVDQFAAILSEFRRVLKPGGRLVLVNMSKEKPGRTFYETMYGVVRLIPCRPVVMDSFVREAGFNEVQRFYRTSYTAFLPLPFGTEIITAHRPE